MIVFEWTTYRSKGSSRIRQHLDVVLVEFKIFHRQTKQADPKVEPASRGFQKRIWLGRVALEFCELLLNAWPNETIDLIEQKLLLWLRFFPGIT